MSTLVLEHLKHTNASSNNITLAADGSLTLGSVTGDLTVDTDTLKVDATNDRVYVNRTSQSTSHDAFVVSSPAGGVGGGNTRVNATVTAEDLTGDSGAHANAFLVTKAKGNYYNGLEISSTSGHVGGWVGHWNGSSSARELQARVGGSGINSSDNLALRITEEGFVKQPQRPFFFAYPNEGAGGHNATSEWTSMGGTHYDNGSNFSGARFTAPVGGYYFFIAWFQEETYYGSWNSPISIFWYKNGSYQFYYGNDNPGIQDAYSEMKIGNSVITYLAENDTFSAAVRTPNGTPSTEHASGGVMGWLIS